MILVLCFIPLAVIFIVMKFALLASSTNEEINYVHQESTKPHGPYVDNPYADLDEKEEED